MPPVQYLVPDPAAPTCSEACGGNGWIDCWHCCGAGVFCGCWDDCTGECEQPELFCPEPVTCRDCAGKGGRPCPVCRRDDAPSGAAPSSETTS